MPNTRTPRLLYYHGLERARYLGSWLVALAATLGFASLGVAASWLDRSGRLAHLCGRLWGRTLLWICGIVLRVQGGTDLDPTLPYVFVANHQSALDIPALLVALPVRFRMLAKQALFRIPVVGWYMQRAGYVSVDRSDPARAGRSLGAAMDRLGNKLTLLVFAEGTRSQGGQLGDFKKGSVWLARRTGLPLVPVALVNSGRLLPPGARWPDPGVIEVRIGSPLMLPPQLGTAEGAARIREHIERLAAARP